MALSPVNFSNFGLGLNLRDGPDVVQDNQAIDALNVQFTERGTVAQRPGYASLTSNSMLERADSVSPFYTSGGTKQLLAGTSTRLEAINTSGNVVANATGLTASTVPWSFARFGGPAAEVAYTGNGQNTLRKWNGTSWSTPTATVVNASGVSTTGLTMPKGSLLAVDSTDNRLVVAGFKTTTGGPNNATTTPSHVYFSDAGLPEQYGVNNFIQLRPGDGESIMAMVAFREYIFVFKETAFFVFFGTSVDGNGNPIFDYRAVEAGVGCVAPGAACVGPEGVYFLARDGVYRTDGGEPQKVSALIDPIFGMGTASDFYQGGIINTAAITACRMQYYNRRVYLAFPASATSGVSATNNRMAVFSPEYGWWSVFDIPAAAMTSFRTSNEEELVFAYASGSNRIGRHAKSFTNDDGTAITSRWRSGWLDFGAPNLVKTQREAHLWGKGKLAIAFSRDFRVSEDQSEAIDFAAGIDVWSDGTSSDTWGDGTGSDKWGPQAAIEQVLVRKAIRGHVFSVALSNSTLDQTWAVHRLALHLRGQRGPTTTKVD